MNRAVVASAGAALGASFVLDPAHPLTDAVVCPFRLVTGLPCPGCGLGHGFVALAHGDVAASFAAHPFAPISFAGCVGIVVVAIAERVLRRPRLGAAITDGLRAPALATLAAWLSWSVFRIVA
jgi:hypothetical protein